MAATYEAAPGTTRRALSAAGAVSLLVAGAYALGVVRIGADLIGESTWPVELGFDRNGDYTYPRVSEAAIGAVVVLVGVLLVVVVARAIRGSRSAAAGAAVFLASQAGSYMNGQTMVIDGGRVAGPPRNN